MSVTRMILLLARSAMAVTWWVAAPEEAEAVRTALDTGWPGHAIAVEVGPPGAGDAVWVEEGTVKAHIGDADHQQSAPTLELQVVLVRSWARDLVVEDAGWIPDPPATAETLDAPEEEDELPEDAPHAMWAASLGGGARFAGSGLATGAFEAGIRRLGVGGILRLEGLAGEIVDDGDFGYRARSGALTFGFVVLPRVAPKLSWSAGVGVRVTEQRVLWFPPVSNPVKTTTSTQPTARTAIRWTEPVGALRIGLSAALAVDAPLELDSPDLRDAEWPLLGAAELVVERR